MRRAFDAKYDRPVLGMDEVGAGCIAGPVTVAGVVIPGDREIQEALLEMGLNDSKQMTDPARRRVYAFIEEQNFFRVVVLASPEKISKWGLTTALDYLYTKVAAAFYESHEGGTILIDGNQRDGVKVTHVGVVKGDTKSLSIAAASVVAKTERDNHMIELAKTYPKYGFERHVGYPTRDHLQFLELYGPTDIHRGNTRPVKRAIAARARHQKGVFGRRQDG